MKNISEFGTIWARNLMAAALLFSACSDDPASGSASPDGGAINSGSPISSSSEFISKLCAEFSGCCKAAGLPTDGASCRAVYSAFSPKSGYDGKAAGNCIAQLKKAGDTICGLEFDTVAPSCNLAYASPGTKKPGETCSDNDDCAPSPMGKVECATQSTGGETIQKCQVTLRGKLGSDPCVGSVEGNLTWNRQPEGDIPAVGYLCYRSDALTCSSDTNTCVALLKVGESCKGFAFEERCVDGAFCDGAAQCAMKGGLRAPCRNDEECIDTHYCGVDETCAARSKTGAACTEDSQCLSDSCVNRACESNNSDEFGLVFLCGSN